jgi:hypothetical protein
MILTQLLLSMETVRLAEIDKLIRAELEHRAEYAIKFGVHARLIRYPSCRADRKYRRGGGHQKGNAA